MHLRRCAGNGQETGVSRFLQRVEPSHCWKRVEADAGVREVNAQAWIFGRLLSRGTRSTTIDLQAETSVQARASVGNDVRFRSRALAIALGNAATGQ